MNSATNPSDHLADFSSAVQLLKNLQQLNASVQNILDSTDKSQPELFSRINQVINSLRGVRESIGQIEHIGRSEAEQRELIADLQ